MRSIIITAIINTIVENGLPSETVSIFSVERDMEKELDKLPDYALFLIYHNLKV